ncbi:MAG: glycosyltransferase family 2 protein [Halieaceae bacterium]|nr:glycosyltransferase family 2 protein [Halieaceae bacterium]
MTTPVISVCIANYQGSEVIERCLDSVLAQECRVPFEVIVHDDASTDGSGDLVARDYPQVEVLRSDRNLGFCGSNNRLVDAACGRFVLLLNNDTRLHPGSLQTLLDAAEGDPCTGVWSLPQYAMDSGELLDRGMFMDWFANPVPALQPAPEVATVMGSCLFLRRELWREIGGFPDWFGSLAEDMYLCNRVRLMGLKVRVTDGGGYDHVVGHSFGGGKVTDNRLSSSYRRRRLSELNKNRVIATCFPAPLHLLVLLLQVPLLLTEAIAMSLASRSLRPLREIYLPSITGIMTDLPRLQRDRQRCMRARATSLRAFLRPMQIRHHKLTLLFRHGIPGLS